MGRPSTSSNNYLGLTNYNNKGDLMKIIEVRSYNDITVEFQDEFHYKANCSVGSFKKGNVTNFFGRHVCGIGYLGNTRTQENGKVKRSYYIWYRMIDRCYNPKALSKRPTYKGCSVCDEWQCYANFEKWYEENYYDCHFGGRMCVDKDILFKGNKIYSPQTCCIIPQEINCLFTATDSLRGEYPIGVYKWKNGLNVQVNKIINNKSTRVHVGYFGLNEVDKAFFAYKIEKEKYIKEQAEKFKEYLPQNVYEALYNYKVETTD